MRIEKDSEGRALVEKGLSGTTYIGGQEVEIIAYALQKGKLSIDCLTEEGKAIIDNYCKEIDRKEAKRIEYNASELAKYFPFAKESKINEGAKTKAPILVNFLEDYCEKINKHLFRYEGKVYACPDSRIIKVENETYYVQECSYNDYGGWGPTFTITVSAPTLTPAPTPATPTIEQLEQLFDGDCPDMVLLEEMAKSLGFENLDDWLLCRFE